MSTDKQVPLTNIGCVMCSVCFTASWEPTPDGERCGYCWLVAAHAKTQEQLRLAETKLQPVEEVNRTITQLREQLAQAQLERDMLLGKPDAVHVGAQCAVEALRQCQKTREDLDTLKEAVSPGRIGEIGYYIGVAKRMRHRETVIKPMKINDAPLVTEPTICQRPKGHSGPCNGYPKDGCAALRAKQEPPPDALPPAEVAAPQDDLVSGESQ